MDRDHIGTGWGTEAQRALAGVRLPGYGLAARVAHGLRLNARAIRSYEKLGFQREGLMRQSWRGPSGLEDRS